MILYPVYEFFIGLCLKIWPQIHWYQILRDFGGPGDTHESRVLDLALNQSKTLGFTNI